MQRDRIGKMIEIVCHFVIAVSYGAMVVASSLDRIQVD